MIYECLYDTIRDDVNIKNVISINLFQQVQLKSKLNIDDSWKYLNTIYKMNIKFMKYF